MNNKQDLLQLINSYVADANRLVGLLKLGLAIDEPLLHAYRGGLISQTGQVEGVEYALHGGGVALADKTTQIDLELGADDFAGAFDAWRLARYAEARKTEEFLKFTDARHVEAALQELLAHGAIQSYEYLGNGFYCLPV